MVLEWGVLLRMGKFGCSFWNEEVVQGLQALVVVLSIGSLDKGKSVWL